jgi:long-chain acyl-CoA synthetase
LRVEELLTDTAQRIPAKVALTCADRRLTYAEIDSASQRLAGSLQALGVRRGCRVVVHLENGPEAVLAIFAILKARGVFVLINPTVKAEKLAYILADCAPTVVIGDVRAHTALSLAVSRARITPAVILTRRPDLAPSAAAPDAWFDEVVERPESTLPDEGIDLDLAALVYTSGSTGFPKGVMLSHLNICAAAESITTYLEMRESDVVLNVLPLSFDYGLYQVLMTFKVGGHLVLERALTYVSSALDLMVREQVTGLPIVPTIGALLLKHLSGYDLPHLRYITNTGAALPPAYITAIRRALPHVRVFSMYGLTECKRVSYLPPEEIDERPTSVGRAMPNLDTFLVDETGNRLHGSGTGQLVVRGSTVMQGYWNLPQETDRVLREGLSPQDMHLYTGDIFRMDDEGYLFFVGRTDDIIKSRGEKVSPREVENVLHGLPGVSEAVVVGVPDVILGEAIHAHIRLDRGAALTAEDILRYCTERLEDFMVPQEVHFVEQFAQTTTGKIDRRGLAGSVQ